MKTRFTAALAVLFPLSASAHPGHVNEVAGHDHVGLYVAAGAALLLVVLSVIARHRKSGNR